MKKHSPANLLLALALLSFAACQKEPDENLLPSGPTACPLIRIDYLEQGGGIADTAGFVYNGNAVSRVNYSDYYITLSYTGTRLTRRNYYDYSQPGSSPLYDSFVYNGSGSLTAMESYLTDPGLPADFLYSRSTLTYSGNQLLRLQQFADTAFSGTQSLLYQYDYRYAGNNIDRCIATYFTSFETDTLHYQYDNQENLFKTNPDFLVTDNLFSDLAGELLPLAFSANNLASLQQSSGTYSFNFLANANGQLSEMRVDGSAFSRYTYKCP